MYRKTSFYRKIMEKVYDHLTSEKEIAQRWQDQQTYSMKNNPGKLYSIDTPPPTVSGSLHIGHIFSYTQTDIIARFKRMSGFSVFYPFGFDDNGLPTERFVEKKLEINAHSMQRSEFINVCLKETQEVEKEFKTLWQRMGLSVDWNHEYSTISSQSRKISQESFIRLYKKGHIYRKYEPAIYCTTCHTSVAQAELDDAQKPSVFYDIAFKTVDGAELIIGTTRPELLASCVALFYNPQDARYKHLKDQQAHVPFYGFTVPIYADENVSIEKGTGLVMCCTFGDKTDILWFKKFKLPYKQSIGKDGKFTQETGPLAGMRVATARQTIIQLLKEQNLVRAEKQITHAVNVHERCKKEIEYIALSQWFLNVLEHKNRFLELADEITWSPTFMKSRYKNWVENISWDWCLSRQRFYGIPFPVWYCKDNNHVILADIKELPIDPQEVTLPKMCHECSCTEFIPDTDIMDTWNTSSLTPQLCLALFNPNINPFDEKAAANFIPMSMRPQAHDIIRTWAFYTIVKAWFHYKTIPWNDIVISGHVLSDEKTKISKSQGNNPVAPENLLKTYPADVIRYWTASGGLGQDIAFSENQLKIGQRLCVKLWNAFRFIAEHGQKPAHVPRDLGVINEWILHQVSATFAQYNKHLQTNEFGLALAQIEKFFWSDLCDNYLEIVKDQLFNPDKYDAQELPATKWTLHVIGLRVLQMFAPYLPFITDSLYADYYLQDHLTPSLHQTRFEDIQKKYTFEKSIVRAKNIISIIGHVRKLKTLHKLSLKVELGCLEIYVPNQEKLDEIARYEQLIKGITHADKIRYKQDMLEEATLQNIGEEWYAKVSPEMSEPT